MFLSELSLKMNECKLRTVRNKIAVGLNVDKIWLSTELNNHRPNLIWSGANLK